MAQSTDTIDYGIFSISAFQHFSMDTSTGVLRERPAEYDALAISEAFVFTYVSQH